VLDLRRGLVRGGREWWNLSLLCCGFRSSDRKQEIVEEIDLLY